MAVIIFIILFALFACLNGDSSGVEAIAKVIGGVALFIVAGSIIVFMMDYPAIIIGIIVIAIVVAIIYNLTKQNNSKFTNYHKEVKEDYNIYNNTYYEEKTESLSDFQKELQQSTKTPQQASDEKWVKEQSEIIKIVQSNYETIKSKLMNKAKNGEYTCLSNCKSVNLMYESDYLSRCLNAKSEMIYEKQFLSSHEIIKRKFTVYLNNKKGYDFYIKEIKKLANNDNINIDIILLRDGILENRDLPFSFITTPSSYAMVRFNLNCTIYY